MSQTIDLVAHARRSCEEPVSPLARSEIELRLAAVSGWTYRDGIITKTFRFPDYWQTMAFVNATAWISHREDHHPDITAGYNSCRVEYSTHSVNGVSTKDFVCAAKLDALFDL